VFESASGRARGRLEITLALGGAFGEVAQADRVGRFLLGRLLARARGEACPTSWLGATKSDTPDGYS
jgi:hypothetical protein